MFMINKNQQKLVVLQGLPGSGKSTWAREFISGKTNWGNC